MPKQSQLRTTTIIFSALAALVLVLAMFKTIHEAFRQPPTKCFSCERQYPPEWQWLGQNTKCFSCERDLLQRTSDPQAVFQAHPIKYY